ncbi:hypothetical protein [Cupriavidus taiwanensis]|uniref:hypothetical protein n=1 Tax=Cupriavidus taiwanensis TaxID=164546 RepID=UPI0027953B13|nr:hypothetical protein [Cupriavidus taiwanensis]
MGNNIRDVPMNEELARLQADKLIRRHPAISAPNPKALGGLLPRQGLKEARLHRIDAARPTPVLFQQSVQLDVAQMILGCVH